MILKYGDLMDSLYNYKSVFITANAFIKSNGTLVMGRGFALSCAKKYPTLPAEAGKRISGGIFGIIEDVLVTTYGADSFQRHELSPKRISLGLFQVKFNWWQDADLDLVEYSTRKLAQLADENPDNTYALNYPAIGNGKLAKELIEPIIQTLPDNVHVWQFRPCPWELEKARGYTIAKLRKSGIDERSIAGEDELAQIGKDSEITSDLLNKQQKGNI